MAADSPLDVADLRERVAKALGAFLGRAEERLGEISSDLLPVGQMLTGLLQPGGKLLRPAFCYWGWRGAGAADTEEIVAAAASLELLHACALIHDDVMDRSDIRRGAPAVHRRFAEVHRRGAWRGDPESFGTSAAILLGDLCLVWADELLTGSGLPAERLARAGGLYASMRMELMAGQYLDLLEQASPGPDVRRALRAARFKTAKYTVERPLQLGGLLAGASAQLLAAYGDYGVPLGEAFQLRDDILGVFGDPLETGKPAGDDLREGKQTVLVALALERATPPEAEWARAALGDPQLDDAGVAELRSIITGSGALRSVELLIQERTDWALAAIAGAPMDGDARNVLTEMAQVATTRVT